VFLVAAVALSFALHPAPAIAGQPGDAHAQPNEHATTAGAETAEHGGEHGGLAGLMWPVANFVVLAGGLYYFLRTPFGDYLSGRSTQIRKDLVEAGELTRSATAQLAEVDRKLHALPGEIESLKKRSIEEMAAEDERIASAAAADRARLLTQTRREIEVRLQTAQRELSEHAASLAIELARKRLATEITSVDHARLVDRYVQQVKD
jgi:F0F1-type ATP synthase membrane subunit b/b'